MLLEPYEYTASNMKLLNDIARKVSPLMKERASAKAVKSSAPSDPSSEIPSVENHKTPDEMHSELSTMICPDCHDKVKGMMVKHGLMPHPHDSEDTGSIKEHSMSDSLKD